MSCFERLAGLGGGAGFGCFIVYHHTVSSENITRPWIFETGAEVLAAGGETSKQWRPLKQNDNARRQKDCASESLGRKRFIEENRRQNDGQNHAEFINRSDFGDLPELKRLEITEPG